MSRCGSMSASMKRSGKVTQIFERQVVLRATNRANKYTWLSAHSTRVKSKINQKSTHLQVKKQTAVGA